MTLRRFPCNKELRTAAGEKPVNAFFFMAKTGLRKSFISALFKQKSVQIFVAYLSIGSFSMDCASSKSFVFASASLSTFRPICLKEKNLFIPLAKKSFYYAESTGGANEMKFDVSPYRLCFHSHESYVRSRKRS